MMSRKTVDAIIDFLRRGRIQTLDLTGGAPEMNRYFRDLVTAAREMDITIIDRCNLTILLEPGYESLAVFLAENGVEINASLPCYLEENVDRQRGDGVFTTSIRAIRRLNELGYGHPGTDLRLNLVYNPQGPTLPPSQNSLETAYRQHLLDNYGIHFNQLLVITNMPIQRFGSTLISKGQFESYMQLLRENHKEENLQSVMCRSLLSVDWQGYVYDCDFNQMLKIPMPHGKRHISEIKVEETEGMPITVLDHCYACTAGQGSSCGGALD